MSADGPVEYDSPAGGWGSLRGIREIFGREASAPAALETLARQNKPGGVMCVSCSWAKPPDPHAAEFCENGAKATLWELTSKRCTPAFFADHTLDELRSWDDYALELEGRLTDPLRYDAATDTYIPWRLGRGLRGDRRRTQGARSEIGRLLCVGARQSRDVVPLRTDGPALRQQQPARQF